MHKKIRDMSQTDRWRKGVVRKGLHMLSSGLKPKGDGEEDQCWSAGEKKLSHQRWEQWLVGACLPEARDIQSRTGAQS